MSWVEPLWISKVGHTVLTRLMESQMWLQPINFVGEELSKGAMASAGPDARHSSLLLYTTGALQAATLVLELSGSKSKYMSPVGFPQEELLRAPAASSTNPIPTAFCSQKLGVLIFLILESWARGPGVGSGLLAPEIPLPNFYPPHKGVGPTCSASPSLLPVWMDVVSLIPELNFIQLYF